MACFKLANKILPFRVFLLICPKVQHLIRRIHVIQLVQSDNPRYNDQLLPNIIQNQYPRPVQPSDAFKFL